MISQARFALRQAIAWAAIEKSVLSLHASSDMGSFWKAMQKVIRVAIPDCSLGVSLRHNPVLRVTQRWTRSFHLPPSAPVHWTDTFRLTQRLNSSASAIFSRVEAS